MRGYRKKQKTYKKEKVLYGKDYVCFFALAKETAKTYGKLEFVIVDKNGEEVPLCITDSGTTWINGKQQSDAEAREYIAKNIGEFERLFLEATKKNDPEMQIMPKLYVAKLTDMSGTYQQPASINFYDGKKMKALKIESGGYDGIFHLDDIQITKEDAIACVSKNYGQFLVGMKAAIKAMKNTNKYENNKFPSTYGYMKKQQIKHSEVVDGKLLVDIDSFLPQKRKQTTKQNHEMTSSKEILSNQKRGYLK